MKNGIIKGGGNSRYLKSVPDFLAQYPDYDSFAQAMASGTLPIDLNGVNPQGWTQLGTPLDAANLLSDPTAGSMGLSEEESTPDVAFSHLNAGKLSKNGDALNHHMGDTQAAQVRNIELTTEDMKDQVGQETEKPDGTIIFVYE